MPHLRYLICLLSTLLLTACAPAQRGVSGNTFMSRSPEFTFVTPKLEPRYSATIDAILAQTGFNKAPLTYMVSEGEVEGTRAAAIVIVAESPGGWRWKQLTPSAAHLLGVSHRVTIAGKSFNAISFRYEKGQDCFGISKGRDWIVRRFTRLERHDSQQLFIEYREYSPGHATADRLHDFEERAQQAFELSFNAPSSKLVFDSLAAMPGLSPLHIGTLMGPMERIPLPLYTPKTTQR